MRAYWAKVCSSGLLLIAGLPAGATITPLKRPDTVADRRFIAVHPVDEGVQLRESLRRDVTTHPNDFVVFETEAGAQQFVAQHWAEVRPETNRNIESLGVVGYWQGKTMVVLPWEPVKNFQ
jgi:hypothetical protein